MTDLDSIPLWLIFVGAAVLVLATIEAGHRLGTFLLRGARRRLHSGNERESATEVITTGLISLTSFFLAFTFGMVADRYESRVSLVREDADALRTAYLRTGLLQEPERSRARLLLRQYLDERVQVVAVGDVDADHVAREQQRLWKIQHELWLGGIASNPGSQDSGFTTMYLESLSDVFAVDARRWAVGYQSRLPAGVWGLLAALNTLGMFSIGFMVANSGSDRSLLTPALALAFAVVVTLIAALDRPDGHVHVSQKPLLELRAYIAGQGI